LNAADKAWATRRNKAKQPAPPPKKKVVLKPQEPIVMPKQVPTASVEEMMLRTVVLVITINGIGNRRKVDPDSINVTDSSTNEDVNKEWLGVTKKLMNAPELKKIAGICSKAKQCVTTRALPSFIKQGVYLLPKEFDEETDTKLKAFQAEMQPHIEELASNLPEYKKEAKKEQGTQFREDQFPTAAQIRTAFRINWRFLYVDSAKGLSKALAEEERRKSEEAWKETRETIQQVLRANLSDMVNHMVDRLSPNEHGEKHIFRDSAVTKFQDFLATFDARNITNDAQMKILVDKAKSLIANTNTETLRTDQDTRDYVLHGFETIKTLLDPMIVNKPHRAIRLEE
jgi:hypothetical protein